MARPQRYLDVDVKDDVFCVRMRERADWRHIKIIMLSAKGRDVEVAKGLSVGADLYITKPFSTRDLLRKVKELLEKP